MPVLNLLDSRKIIEAAIEEYHLLHIAESDVERVGRRNAIRGLMVRLNVYSDFCRAHNKYVEEENG